MIGAHSHKWYAYSQMPQPCGSVALASVCCTIYQPPRTALPCTALESGLRGGQTRVAASVDWDFGILHAMCCCRRIIGWDLRR